MATKKQHLPKGSNVIRFYINDSDKVIKCDYIENIDKPMHEEITLSDEKLRSLFVRYIKDDEIDYEEKLCDRYIIHKFYDIDVEEIHNIIKISRKNQSIFNKFKLNNTKPIQKKKRKVIRKNKFDGKKAIITLATITILSLPVIAIGKSIIDKSPTIETDSTHKESVIEITDNDYSINSDITSEINTIKQNTIPQPIQINLESESIIESETQPEIKYDQYIEIYADDWTSTDKYIYAKENYYDLILKYSQMYGIDPQIALAMASHERGYHSNEVDIGGAIGLFQVQIEGGFNWDNKDVYAYNFETNSNEKYTIHKEDVANVENNIKAGLMIFQNCLRNNNYDIAKSIQEYNYGHRNMKNVLETCYTSENLETEENKLEWLSYRNIIKNGDANYLENVLKYVNNDSVFEFKTKDGETITCKYTNLTMSNTENDEIKIGL